MTLTLWLCIGLAFLVVGCRAAKDFARSDAERLQGSWQLIYQEANGKKLPDEEAAAMFHGKMVFASNKLHYTIDLQGFDFHFVYELHPDQQPKVIDLELTDTIDNRGIGKKFFGIYILDNNTLTICYSIIKRPTDFNAGKESHNTLILLKRKMPRN